MAPVRFLRSLKIKLGAVIISVAAFSALLTWLGLRRYIGPTRTFPIVIAISAIVALLIGLRVSSRLKEMTGAVGAMAQGEYGQQVRDNGDDEIGQLATAFNQMAGDLASAEQARRDLIANVSHELRTPVAALQAQLENLVDGVVYATPAVLESAHAQTERLTRLVNYLLDLSRVEAGVAELNLDRLSVGDFLEDCANDLSMVESGKDLTYLVDVTPPNLSVDADPERLRQIIVNLVHNAIRYSPVGGEISLKAYPSGEWVFLEISDEGPGIDPADREKIFERFSSARKSTAPVAAGGTGTGGTGIGLAIVRWAVNLHGGRVSVVDSASGVGATVRLALPARSR